MAEKWKSTGNMIFISKQDGCIPIATTSVATCSQGASTETQNARAAQIVREHNDYGEVVELLRGMYELADDGSASFDDPHDDSIYLKVKAALAKEK